jgi:Cytochrome c554 and c-prime
MAERKQVQLIPGHEPVDCNSKKSMKLRYSKYLIIGLGSVAVGFILFAVYWDLAAPQDTCASCHEIESPTAMWARSGHRNLKCNECHGTFLSTGFHSLVEKGMMFVHHFTGSDEAAIRLNETQVVSMIESCKRCHSIEYARWSSGGHSAPYSAIFLNEKHNSSEQLHADCLRCHGMFYSGTIGTLVSPLSVKGPWKINDVKEASRPVIPCLTCHQVHFAGSPAATPDYSNPQKMFYNRPNDTSYAFFYDRYEKFHFEGNQLPELTLWQGNRKVDVSDDFRQKVCIQCHAPNAFHQAGTSDDRTPRGVHEGLSCLACHDPHSNSARQSCINCHPAIEDCGLDVTTMNTTFADRNSPHNIHWVDCKDCHTKGIPKAKT